MSASPASPDRRHRRRAETIEQVIDIAIAVMGEVGVAGLSLGEVARRMGMRTPSLCGYFASKNDVYDAVFSRGWRSEPYESGTFTTMLPQLVAMYCAHYQPTPRRRLHADSR